jgi:hypothetical protein
MAQFGALAPLGPDQLASVLEEAHLNHRGRELLQATRCTREIPETAPVARAMQYNASNVGKVVARGPPRQPLAPLSMANIHSHLNARLGPNTALVEKTRISKHENMRRRAQWQPRTPPPRNPIREFPIPLRVYFMPDGRYVHQNSIIHKQKRQSGFFLHPILVIRADHDQGIAHFYALTSNLPDAIRDLRIYLRFGTTTVDEGEHTLKLAESSERMQQVTFANMEQLFRVEFQYLDHWRGNVTIHADEWAKIQSKVDWLESEQNRYIYKPLQRSMKDIVPGMILMLPNPPEASTLGAPILVLDVCYPHFRFLRVKEINGKGNVEYMGKAKPACSCLRLCRYPDQGNDPVLLFAPNSSEMRNPSYLECSRKIRWVHCDSVKTWSYPHIRISSVSMDWLLWYLTRLPEPQSFASAEPAPVVIRGPHAFPQVPRIQHPPSVPAFHPNASSTLADNNNTKRGSQYPQLQQNAIPLRTEAAENSQYTPSSNKYSPYTPQIVPFPPPYPMAWGYHPPQPMFPLVTSTGRTAHTASSTSTSATGCHTESSDFGTGIGDAKEV